MQVYPPSISELDEELSELVRENGALDGYVKANDQQRAVQLSISVLSTLDFLQQSNNTEVSQLKFQKYQAPIIYIYTFSFIMAFLPLFWLRGSPFKPSNLYVKDLPTEFGEKNVGKVGLPRMTLVSGKILFHINAA